MSGRSGIQNVRSALTWAGGVQLVQDFAQFAAMLLLVRLLSPEEYGAMALAQAILGIATLVGAGTFIPHALQVRDPGTIKWQSHFTAGTICNAAIGVALLAVAGFLVTPIWGADVGLTLAVLASAPLFGGPASIRNAMLRVNHDWSRFRLLCLIGTFLSLGVGLALGFGGFGVLALAVQPALYVLPSAIDLFWSGFRPTWRLDRAYYRDVIGFGLNRFAAGSVTSVRGFAEQALMASNFSLAVNGVYGRSIGLSNLLAGRVGLIALGALYPILTRAEQSSPKFRRNAARLLQGVAWIAIPAAAFLAIEAESIVALLYGPGWADVAQLLPASSALAAAGTLHITVSRLLLANESRRASLAVDAGSGLLCIGLAFWLMPQGPGPYLWAVAGVGSGSFLCGVFLLKRSCAIEISGAVNAVVPPLLAAAMASACLFSVGSALDQLALPIQVGLAAACFGLSYFGFLLVVFSGSTFELLAIIPGMARLRAERH